MERVCAIRICIYEKREKLCVCVCVCVCEREREKERKRKRGEERKRERERERESAGRWRASPPTDPPRRLAPPAPASGEFIRKRNYYTIGWNIDTQLVHNRNIKAFLK